MSKPTGVTFGLPSAESLRRAFSDAEEAGDLDRAATYQALVELRAKLDQQVSGDPATSLRKSA